MAIFSLLVKMSRIRYGHGDVSYMPEEYIGASGELLVVAMVISWVLTYAYNSELIEWNPLKARVGYNNLCVGWDEPPAVYAAAPLFVLIIWVELQYMIMEFWRMSLTPSMTRKQVLAVYLANFLNGMSWICAIGIFVITPMKHPVGHTASFVQLVVFGYLGYAANLVEADSSTHPKGSWVFLTLYGLCSAGFGLCAFIQFAYFDEHTGERGPIPWYVTAFFDYSWFVCLTLQGNFRPSLPAVVCSFGLKDHDDAPTMRVAYTGVKPLGGGMVGRHAPPPGVLGHSSG